MGTISHAEWVQCVEQVRGWAAMCGHDGSFFQHTTKPKPSFVTFVVSSWARKLAGGT